MNDLDRMIRDALAEDEVARLDAVSGPQSLFQQGLDLFRKSERWLIVIVVVSQFAFLVLLAWSAWSFFQTPATELKTLLAYGGLFLFSLLATSMLKLWSWMEINKNAVTREVKRLELQVAYLSGRMQAAGEESASSHDVEPVAR